MERPFRFRPPPVGSRAFVRPRLHARFAARFELRMVVVQAGAGFGKTTLLTQGLAENALDPRGIDVWLGCEPGDSSESTLVAALLQGMDHRPQRHRGAMRHDPTLVMTIDDVCDAVWTVAPEQVCLVLDDVHTLAADSAGLQAIVALIERLPTNGHLVIATRYPLELPTTRLRLAHRCDVLSEDDLRLDGDELSRLAASHGVDPQTLAGVAGWPALAELTASAGGSVAASFVLEEVLAPLGADLERAFATIVALGGGDAETVGVACGQTVDLGRLGRLPLVTTIGRDVIRPHALWEELLAGRLTPTEVGEARRRAAGSLRGRGANAEAFELLAAAGEWGAALPALFDACNDQVHPPWPDVMERWLALVPAEMTHEAEVAYLRAMIERARDSWGPRVVAEFEAADRGFRARGDIASEVAAVIRASSVAMVRDDRDFMATVRRRGEELVAAGLPLEPVLWVNDTWRAYAEGRFADVLAITDQEMVLEPRLRHFPSFYRVAALLAAGRAEEAAGDAALAAERGAVVAPALAAGWAMSAPAFVALGCGDLTYFDGRVPLHDLGPRFALAERVPHLAVAAIVAANSGRPEQAAHVLASIDALFPSDDPRPMIDGFRAVAAAAVAVGRGDEAEAGKALANGLRGTLSPVASGMAVRWFPVLPYLLHPPSRAILDTEVGGPTRAIALETCRWLIADRDAGSRVGPSREVVGALNDVATLAGAFGVTLAVELLVRADTSRRATERIEQLVERAPESTRAALHSLARGPNRAVANAATALLTSIAIPPPHALRIEFLGPARLLRDGEIVDDAHWRRARVRQLVALLVAQRRVRRQLAGAYLWPDADDDAVSANLRMTLSYVQALFEPHRAKGDAPWFVQQESAALVLDGGRYLSVDVWEFERSIEAAGDARRSALPSIELGHLLAAIDEWRGDPFEDAAGLDWADAARERLRERYIAATIRGGELLVAAGDTTRAADVAEAGLTADPWSEALHRVLISAHLEGGNVDSARRTLSRCSAMLDELGVAASPATEAVAARLTAG